MKKQTIKLNESQLNKIIRESVMETFGSNGDGIINFDIFGTGINAGKDEKLPRGWEKIERENDEPIYRDEDFNEYVKDEYGNFQPLNETKNKKQIMRLNESQLRKIIKEALNEIGDTLNGQEALGALHAKKVYNNCRTNYKKTGGLAHNPTPDEKEVYDYAEKKRGGNNDMETAYANGYIKQRDKENSKGINESKLNNIIKENIKKVLNENDFAPHGYMTTSNLGGKEIEISYSGDAARFRTEDGSISDWFEIEYDEEGNPIVNTPWGTEDLNNYMRIN